jgi:DNA-binding transcriptional regulator PaaX
MASERNKSKARESALAILGRGECHGRELIARLERMGFSRKVLTRALTSLRDCGTIERVDHGDRVFWRLAEQSSVARS